jgi:hypothetical protein
MEAVRQIVSADMLMSIIDLPWTSKGLQVEVIVLPLIEEKQQKKISEKKLKGCLKAYANPALWEKEQQAWETNIIEKYGNI